MRLVIMDSIDERAVETLCQAIVQTVKNSTVENDMVATVVGVDGGYCNVSISGNEYKVKNGIGVNMSVGDRVLVHLINGNFENKIIIAKM